MNGCRNFGVVGVRTYNLESCSEKEEEEEAEEAGGASGVEGSGA